MTIDEKRVVCDFPEELKEIAEMANRSRKVLLPNLSVIFRNCYRNLTVFPLTKEVAERVPMDENYAAALIEAWGILKHFILERSKNIVGATSPELYAYVVGDSDTSDVNNLKKLLARFEEFRENRIVLKYIAKRTSYFAETNQNPFQLTDFNPEGFDPPEFPSLFKISSEGLIDFQDDVIRRNLQFADAKRIRICSLCERIFWAKRLDKKGCSTKCNQTLRTRRKREREKNRFQPRTKNNGTL